MDSLYERSKVCQRSISTQFPCRDELITKLFVDLNLGQTENVALPSSIYVYGDSGTGKSSVISAFISAIPSKTIHIDCVECYTSKILFETVVNQLFDHRLNAANNYTSYARCDSARDFVAALRKLNSKVSYVIVLDDAQRLRDLEANVLTVFLRLRETTTLNVCCLFVASLPLEKLYPTGGFPLPIVVHWPNYTQKEILLILLRKFQPYKRDLIAFYVDDDLRISFQEGRRRDDIIKALPIAFFQSFLNLCLQTFFQRCRDLKQLHLLSRDCFKKYCEPIIVGRIDCTDVGALYKHVAGDLKAAVNTIYMKIDQNNSLNLGTNTKDKVVIGLAEQMPYFAKYLLIAAYLASHNDVKLDKRLFMKHHGKQRKTQHSIKAKQIVSEKMSTQLGPKSFPIDRLMAIFYAILDEKVPLTCNLMAQIPSLVHLKLLNFVSGESNIMEGSARLQCIVSHEFILQIGRNVGFNVREYLGDFI